MNNPWTTWKELKAQGVQRCCVHYKDGTQCRRRALAGVYPFWCAKHGPIMERIEKETNEMLERTNYGNGR